MELTPKILAYLSYVVSINSLRNSIQEIETTIEALKFAKNAMDLSQAERDELKKIFDQAADEHGSLIKKGIERAMAELKKLREN